MNKLFFVVVIFCSLSFSVFSQTPSMPLPHQSPSQPRILLEDGAIVGASNPMPVTTDVAIGSTTISPVTEWDQQTVSLVAGVAQSPATEIAGSRRFVHLKTLDLTNVFWVAFNASATIDGSSPFLGSAYFEAPKNVEVSIIASTAMTIYMTEGGN